jgi:hypothetical protein
MRHIGTPGIILLFLPLLAAVSNCIPLESCSSSVLHAALEIPPYHFGLGVQRVNKCLHTLFSGIVLTDLLLLLCTLLNPGFCFSASRVNVLYLHSPLLFSAVYHPHLVSPPFFPLLLLLLVAREIVLRMRVSYHLVRGYETASLFLFFYFLVYIFTQSLPVDGLVCGPVWVCAYAYFTFIMSLNGLVKSGECV